MLGTASRTATGCLQCSGPNALCVLAPLTKKYRSVLSRSCSHFWRTGPQPVPFDCQAVAVRLRGRWHVARRSTALCGSSGAECEEDMQRVRLKCRTCAASRSAQRWRRGARSSARTTGWGGRRVVSAGALHGMQSCINVFGARHHGDCSINPIACERAQPYFVHTDARAHPSIQQRQSLLPGRLLFACTGR